MSRIINESPTKLRNLQIGNKYAELDGVQVEPIIVRFFGIFFLFFQFTFVVGSAISSAGERERDSLGL